MPHPIDYPVGTQDDDRTRSIDKVHIEPSIREGVHLVSGLYGSDASAPIFRYPPSNSFPPYLTGDPQIPSVLTCNAGQWDASPAANLYYQWMSDGADIPGANSQQWLSTVDYDNTVITCEVRGENYLGEAYALTSNEIPISLIEPIEIEEQEDYVITGLTTPKVQTMRDEREVVITGLAAKNRVDVNRGVAYFLTGISANNRSDVNAKNINVVTGISQADTFSVLERDYGVGVVSRTVGSPLVDGVPESMSLKNPQAEMGMFGWEIFGASSYEDNQRNEGDYSWHGGYDVDAAQGNTPYSYIWQDVDIYPVHEVDVDAGSCFVTVEWYQYSSEGSDQANIKMEFYAANDTLLGSFAGPGLWSSPSGIFFYRSMEVAIPVNTRYVRIIPEFNLQSGTDNDAQIDSIIMQIRKGAAITSRDFGPTFEQWRIRFTLANTWSGTALSELEFRDGIGGNDLATGGSPIFGSAGLGVANADYAFDDLRNTGYWAGAENAVTEGTAWVGYDMGTPVKPLEIDITARLGTDSFQVGREFFLEGSNDGTNWTKVQRIIESTLGTFTSGQQKQVIIANGPVSNYRDLYTGFGYSYDRINFNLDGDSKKGNVFEAHARFDISHLSVYMEDNTLVPVNFELELVRLNTQKNGSYSIGMVSELLEKVSGQTAGLNAGYGWEEIALSQSYEFEVGDLFLIRFYDLDAATNPTNNNEGRMPYISGYNDELDPFTIKNGIARMIDPWTGGSNVLAIGQTNPNSFGQNASHLYWGIDFKGSVF